ncbi:MAG: hypothetical protein ABII01_03800 [Candidatus Woesearchaeota archaeon]
MISDVLPQMMSIQKSVKQKPSITLYEGKEGIKTVYEDILVEAKEIIGLSPKKSLLNLFEYYMPHFFERRLKAKIKVRCLLDGKPLVSGLLEYRIIKDKFETGYWIYNNKVVIFSLTKKDPLAIVIENKSIADAMRITFELAWKAAEKKIKR